MRSFRIIIIFLIPLVFFSFLSAQESELESGTSTDTPSSFVLKLNNIDSLTKLIQFYGNNFLSGRSKKKYFSTINRINKETGVNFLDSKSLVSFGFSNSNNILYTYKKNQNNKENQNNTENITHSYRIFLPVTDSDEKFVLKFIKILKSSGIKGAENFNPVITNYKGKTVYQLLKDLFVLNIDGYLILLSSQEGVKITVDNSINECLLKNELELLPAKNKNQIYFNTGETEFYFLKDFKKINSFVQNIIGEFNIEENKLDLSLNLKFEKNEKNKDLLSIFWLKDSKNINLSPSSSNSGYFALNFEKLYEFMKKYPDSDVAKYNQNDNSFISIVNEKFYSSLGNYIIMDSEPSDKISEAENFCFSFGLKDPSLIKALWNRVGEYIEKKYASKKGSTFQTGRVGLRKYYNYTSQSGKKYYLIYDNQKLYYSNNLDYFNKYLDIKVKHLYEIKEFIPYKKHNHSFLMLKSDFSSKNSIKNIIMMKLLERNKLLYNFFLSIEKVIVIGRTDSSNVVLNIELDTSK